MTGSLPALSRMLTAVGSLSINTPQKHDKAPCEQGGDSRFERASAGDAELLEPETVGGLPASHHSGIENPRWALALQGPDRARFPLARDQNPPADFSGGSDPCQQAYTRRVRIVRSTALGRGAFRLLVLLRARLGNPKLLRPCFSTTVCPSSQPPSWNLFPHSQAVVFRHAIQALPEPLAEVFDPALPPKSHDFATCSMVRPCTRMSCNDGRSIRPRAGAKHH